MSATELTASHQRDLLPTSDLSWQLRKPCADCPFRRDAPDHEGVLASLAGILESIKAGTFAHTCHYTDNREACDGPRNHDGKVEHCMGALHFLVRAHRDLQLPLLNAAEAGKIDLHELIRRAEKDETVFRSMRELAEYYCAMALRVMDRKEDEERLSRVRRKKPKCR